MPLNNSFQKSDRITKPILKWAGGKTQLLSEIVPRMPYKYRNYIEPFFGGGAVFFALSPKEAIIADSNPELINLYKEVANNVEQVLAALMQFQNTKESFYEVRALEWKELPPEIAAARTLFLNKTCFNGLYRVNKSGHFNVPYGNNLRANFRDENSLRNASKALSKADIICSDYHEVLQEYAHEEDFVFLDPPYVPISEYADFKRYTKEQFSTADQERLAKDVDELCSRGCFVMLTNSNHPLVHELYGKYKVEVFQTKRAISKKADSRTGEDIIVTTY